MQYTMIEVENCKIVLQYLRATILNKLIKKNKVKTDAEESDAQKLISPTDEPLKIILH